MILFPLLSSYLLAVDVTIKSQDETTKLTQNKSVSYFGEDIFRGNFKENQQFMYNPNYIINVGDVISVKMWGAYEFNAELSVDRQGNIFIPKIGDVHLLGLVNSKLKNKIESLVKRVFNSNVYLYADLKQYQPISIFVSGAVEKVGLYKGLSTDSILQFIDKAGGIIDAQGSYRDISILRDRKVVKRIDLYQFLLDGKVESFQFRNGDVILINAVKNFIEVSGDVNRPYIFELLRNHSSVKDVMRFILPKPTANRFMLTSWKNGQEITNDYALVDAGEQFVSKGSKLKFFSDYYVNNVEVNIEGEHRGAKTVMVKKGTTLFDLLSNLSFTPLSEIKNIKFYRKSIAYKQKQLIHTMLKDLEARAFTSDSATVEEANIRSTESNRILKFIERAKKVEPLGQMIIDMYDNLDEIYLEEGDRVMIPRNSNAVIVQGEVNIPNALAYRKNYTLENYIEACGGYGTRANRDNILLIKANGRVVQYRSGDFFSDSSSLAVESGDSILVLGKTESKNILITSSITKILYQVAVGAAVVLRAF